MIRLLLASADTSLAVLLAPTLGREFSVFPERRMDRIREIVASGGCDVLILDLASDTGKIERPLEFFDEIRDSGVPVVVMTDDDTRATALDLVQRGVYNYIRKPPVLQELKIVVRRAHEYQLLKRELEHVRRRLTSCACDRLIGSTSLPSWLERSRTSLGNFEKRLETGCMRVRETAS
jgi:DNA-binding NtrC family response regulator